MLECRDAGSHAAWRAGPRLCVECAVVCLTNDARATLPLLAEELALLRLQVASAARVIVAVVNLGRSSSFPADLLDPAVQVVGAVVRNLRPEERDEAASALLDTCLILAGGTSESRAGLMATALVPLCLQPRSQRLLVAKSGELQELLLSPGLNSEVRGVVLAALRETSPPSDLMVAVATRLQSSAATAPHQLVALLDAMNRVICTLPRTLTRAGSEKLLAVSGELVGVVKRALMSRDPALQECGAQCLLTLLLREETPLAAAALTADLGEFLAEALNTTHHSLLQVVFRCVWLLCTTAASVLYARGLALRLVQGLVRALHLVVAQPAAQDVARAGLGLLATLLLNSQRADAGPEIAQAGLQVLALVRQTLHDEEVGPDVRTAATRVLADLLLVTPRGGAVEWAGVAETVQAAASHPTPPSATCSCFVLRLARGAVTATSGEGEESRAVQQWVQDAILKHTKDCVLLGQVSAVACGRLLAALEQLFAEPSWDGAPRLAKALAARGFLALANRLLTEAELVKRGPSVLAHVLATLARPSLGNMLTWEHLLEGLRDLTDPWLHSDSPPQSPESRDAALALSYCHVIASEFPVACCKPLLPGLLALLRSPLGAAERLPVHGARAALFLLAVASHCEASTWPVPLEAQPLLLRWAPAANLVYTHHPAVLRWALAQNPGVAPPELQAALVAQWLAHDEPPLRVSTLLRAHPSGLTCLLEVVHGGSRSEVAAAAAHSVELALPHDAALVEQLWLRLPLYLQRPTARPTLDEEVGPALLLRLAGLATPADPDFRSCVVAPVCTLLPAILTRAAAASSGPWPRALLVAGLQVARLALTAAHETRDTRGVSSLVGHAGFLQVLQASSNDRTTPPANCAALFLCATLASLQSDLGEQAPKAAVTTPVSTSSLAAALEGALLQPRLAQAALELLAALPDPSEVPVQAYVVLHVDEGVLAKFANHIYHQLHYLTAKCTDGSLVAAGWCALRAVLGWRASRGLSLLPWTHTLLWSSATPPRSADAARQMLLFTCAWTTKLCTERKDKESRLRLLGTTVEHLLGAADQLTAIEGGLDLLTQTLSSAMQLEMELGPRVIGLTKDKLEELQYLH